MTDLPCLEDVKNRPVGDVAFSLYPDIPFDTALPQPWVDFYSAKGVDVRGSWVWGYPPKCAMGVPLPLFREAVEEVRALDAMAIARLDAVFEFLRERENTTHG